MCCAEGAMSNTETGSRILIQYVPYPVRRTPTDMARLPPGSFSIVFELCEAGLDLFQFLTHPRHAREMCIQALIFVEWLNRYDPPNSRPHNVEG